MTYQMRKVNPNTERGWEACVAVEKVLTPGENYLIATFPDVVSAGACLKALGESLEAKTGAVVLYEIQP